MRAYDRPLPQYMPFKKPKKEGKWDGVCSGHFRKGKMQQWGGIMPILYDLVKLRKIPIRRPPGAIYYSAHISTTGGKKKGLYNFRESHFKGILTEVKQKKETIDSVTTFFPPLLFQSL